MKSRSRSTATPPGETRQSHAGEDLNRFTPSGLLTKVLPRGAIGIEASPTEAEEPLWAGEESLVARAVPKRRLEVAAGRACARRALARLPAPVISLPADADRVPAWPPEVRGSITHTEGYAAAAVARAEIYLGLGIDAERIARVGAKLTHLLAKPEERAWLQRLSQPMADRARALLFSAKEAAYKCQFPTTRRFFDFLDARCELVETTSFEHGRFRVCFDHRPSDRPDASDPPPAIDGWFIFSDTMVLTAAFWPARSDDG